LQDSGRHHRICIIRQYYFPLDPRVRREVEALVEAGFVVDILCLRRPGELARESLQGVEVRRFRMTHLRRGISRYVFEYTIFFLWAFAMASRLHVRHRYSVIQVHTLPDTLVFAALIPKVLGARVILDMHEVMPELYSSKFGVESGHPAIRLLKSVERISAGFAHCVITVSRPTRDLLVQRGIPPSKLEVVMNTADERIFTPGLTIRDRHKRHSPSRLILVSHGVLVERHGFQTIVRAVARIRDRYPDVRLLIVGEGEDEGSLWQLTRDLDLERNVEFLGFRPLEEVVRILRGTDIGITANRRDRFTELVVPTKLMEYVTLGIPAVVARLPAVEEYFDESMVHFFEPDDVADLATVISTVASDLVTARGNARRASERFLATYAWSEMRRRYVRLVEEVADHARSSEPR
jgi:glycosyltransferase involved in cell wall biosynthesis